MVTAVVLALLSACAFAVSTVVQHRATGSVPGASGRSAVLRIAARLVRHPGWLFGQAAAAAGFVLHASALRHGQVILVQPLLSSGLVLSLVLGAIVDRTHPGRPLPNRGQWASAGVVVVGLSLFLVAAQPHGGRPDAPTDRVLLAAGVALGLAALAGLYVRRPHRGHRALVAGLAAGIGFGVVGTLLKDVVGTLPGSLWHSWVPLLVVAVGATSIVMGQTAYRCGHLIESLPALTVCEPIVAILLARPLYHERLARGLLAHSGQVLGLLLLAGGVILLARLSARRAATAPVPLPEDRLPEAHPQSDAA
jgi:hypothetical protein